MSDRRTREMRNRPPLRRDATRRVLEELERRQLLTLYTVTNTNDSGPGSLRDAIDTINLDSPTPNEIDFAIPGAGPHVIAPLSPLPTIGQSVFINGYSQAGSSPNTNGPTLPINAALNVVLSGASVPAGTDGLTFNSGGNTIRGLVINGFGQAPGFFNGFALHLIGSNNQVAGNFLGTDAAGSAAVPNFEGIFAEASSSNTIGGTAPADRNLISGNAHAGIDIFASDAAFNLIQGNFLGVGADGRTPVPNVDDGVILNGNSNTTIGGPSADAANVISGNAGFGIAIGTNGGQSPSANNVVAGNRIGTDASGLLPAGNGRDGITLIEGTQNNQIGAFASGLPNTIAFNAGSGITVVGSGTTGNAILGNAIFGNAKLGIDLGDDGVTPNDPGDPDPGPNNLQNFPVLTSAVVSGANLVVSGTIDGPGGVNRVQLFDNVAADPSGFGEGQHFLGETTVAISSGAASFTIAVPLASLIGGFLSATATGPSSDTSEFARSLGIFTVINTNDAGSGSLRQAILNANGVSGLNAIDFAIPGSGVQTIAPLTPLPAITDPVVIDAYTQPGASPNTGGPGLGDDAVVLVEIDGETLPAGSDGLVVTAGQTTIRGLSIYGFRVGSDPLTGNSIVLQGAGGDVVEGNFLGLTASGSAPSVRSNRGVLITGTADQTVGGTATAARNIVSGNDRSGVEVAASSRILVAGNFLGLAPDGKTQVFNLSAGVALNASSDSTIGGTTAAARNVASGNTEGVALFGPGATRNLIVGNYTGTDVTGAAAAPNSRGGIFVSAGATANTIGGTTPGSGNLTSANTLFGINLAGTGTSGNVVLGNLVGTDATGSAAILGGQTGLIADAGASGNTIGGPTPGAANVFSGNNAYGILLGVDGTLVIGNRIGTNLAGAAALSNFTGIGISGANNTIGGVVAGERNIISGNPVAGVAIAGSGAVGNIVLGNFIGTDGSGSGTIPNGDGVSLTTGPSLNTIGGLAPGAGNVISGNAAHGMLIDGPLTTANAVLGNFIGVNAAGNAALGNHQEGLLIDGSPNNTIGGTAPGSGNVISGNGVGFSSDGVLIRQATATGNLFLGNFIGTDSTGSTALGNRGIGIEVVAANTTIGGSASGAGNVISGNQYGISVAGGAAPAGQVQGTLIQGNAIGTDASGSIALANAIDGILVTFSPNNTIGGPSPGQGNLISGNGARGIFLSGSSTAGTIIQGNTIGVDRAATSPLGNSGAGIGVNGVGTTIGGTAPGAGNVIAGNGGPGIDVAISAPQGAIGSADLTVQGNAIGTNRAGASGLGNAGPGITTISSASAIGGLAAGAGNTIAFNAGPGVQIAGAGTGNAIVSNSIYSNRIGIDLRGDGPTPNDPGDPDDGPNGLQNTPVLTAAVVDASGVTVSGALNSTPNATFLIQFFADAGDASGLAEGRVFLGQTSVTTDASGNVPIDVTLSLPGIPAGVAITATATDPAGNTSEFSLDTVVRNTQDSGFGSLRQALRNAQGTVGVTPVIRFAVPNGGQVATIVPASPLPDIAGPIVIDGYTQPGSTPNTLDVGDNAVILVAIDGSNAGTDAAGLFVDSSVSNVTIRGLAIGGFAQSAIRVIAASGVSIAGNFLGTDATGKVARPNSAGVEFIGTATSTVGGQTVADRNVISGNRAQGVLVTVADGVPIDNVISGNYVGTDASGLAALANGDAGLYLLAASGTFVGGTSVARRNVISGNGSDGIRLGASASGTAILGDFIGTDALGASAVPNRGNGILATPPRQSGRGGPFDASIGAPFDGAGNVVSGNALSGVASDGAALQIQFNKIGTDASGANRLGNGGSGILLANDAGSVVGGPLTTISPGNVIAFNGGDGITETGTPAAKFSSNSIFGNAKLGIDLGGDGVTPNRPPTPPDDPNRFPNYPVLAGVSQTSNQTRVTGTFDGTENAETVVEFFANDVADPSGFGQGRTFLGAITFTTDASGHAAFTATLPAVATGQFLTATATSFATSEFSRALPVRGTDTPVVSLAIVAAPDPVGVADVLTYVITATNSGTADTEGVTLLDILPFGVTLTPASLAAIEAAHGGLNVPTNGENPRFVLPFDIIRAGASKSFSFQVLVNQPGTLVDTASISGTNVKAEATITTRAILTFVVLNNRDSGFGSLRQAILNANAHAGRDAITFALPGDQLTIAPSTPLPQIADQAVIDGTTQPGFAGVPIVDIDGTNVASPSASSTVAAQAARGGLVVTAGGTTIRGLIIAGFARDGIVLQGGSGSRVSGTVVRNNADSGILITGSSDNTVGGTAPGDRVIASSNGSVGVQIASGSARNVVMGSYLGLGFLGGEPLPNGQDGVFIGDSPNNTIGGTIAGASNVISANGEADVQIFGAGSSGNVVAGNFIGTDFAGAAGFVASGANGGPTEVGVFVNGAPGNTIGGATQAARNVISAVGAGVELFGLGATGNVVANNFLGTDATGTRGLANSIGAFVNGAPGNSIGAGAGLGNLISGNNIGVRLDGAGATRNLIAGNTVGLNAAGTLPLGNALDGIFLADAPGNTIGGTVAGAGNAVSGNGSTGIQVFGAGAAGNLILGNLVGATPSGGTFGNARVGIFLNDAPNVTVGGTAPGAGNLVAASHDVGIQISGPRATGEVVQGNVVRDSGSIGISIENARTSTVPTSGAGANVVTGSPVAVQATPTPGPAVTGLAAQGAGGTYDSVVLAFSESMNAARANDKRAYRIDILNARGRKVGSVKIASAVYDDATRTARLTFAHAVAADRIYRVTALGTGRRALKDFAGNALDGAGRGGSGTNFAGRFGAVAVQKGAIAHRRVGFRAASVR